MHAPGFCGDLLEPFLFEFIGAPIVIPVITPVIIPIVIPVVIPLLEFLVPFIAIVAVSAPFALAVFLGTEALDIRCISKFQLAAGELGKLSLDGIVMDGLFMPVIIG